MYTQFFMTPVREAKQCFIEAFGGGFRRCLPGNLQTSRNIFRPRVYPITERDAP